VLTDTTKTGLKLDVLRRYIVHRTNIIAEWYNLH